MQRGPSMLAVALVVGLAGAQLAQASAAVRCPSNYVGKDCQVYIYNHTDPLTGLHYCMGKSLVAYASLYFITENADGMSDMYCQCRMEHGSSYVASPGSCRTVCSSSSWCHGRATVSGSGSSCQCGTCATGYFGGRCQHKVSDCTGTFCHGRGSAGHNPVTNKCDCTCNPGFLGARCEIDPMVLCNQRIANVSMYDTTNGACKCMAPYAGTTCTLSCTNANNCNGNAHADPTRGYYSGGYYCNSCNCTGNLTGSCKALTPCNCNGHGTAERTMYGYCSQCQCDAGWAGYTCEIPCGSNAAACAGRSLTTPILGPYNASCICGCPSGYANNSGSNCTKMCTNAAFCGGRAEAEPTTNADGSCNCSCHYGMGSGLTCYTQSCSGICGYRGLGYAGNSGTTDCDCGACIPGYHGKWCGRTCQSEYNGRCLKPRFAGGQCHCDKCATPFYGANCSSQCINTCDGDYEVPLFNSDTQGCVCGCQEGRGGEGCADIIAPVARVLAPAAPRSGALGNSWALGLALCAMLALLM